MPDDDSALPEETCQWCGGQIPEGGNACLSCGALRPRDDLTVPGLIEPEFEPAIRTDEVDPPEDDDERRAREILMELDAYIPEAKEPAPVVSSDPDGDAFVIIGVLAAAAIFGALIGWFLAPPLLQDVFEGAIGVESDGPEAFRRLGAFLGALVSMLFGAMLTTMMRR